MKQITLSVPDEVFTACEQIAKRTGRPMELCVLEFLTRQYRCAETTLTETQIQEAIEALRPYIGSIETGNPNSGDNEVIEAEILKV